METQPGFKKNIVLVVTQEGVAWFRRNTFDVNKKIYLYFVDYKKRHLVVKTTIDKQWKKSGKVKWPEKIKLLPWSDSFCQIRIIR